MLDGGCYTKPPLSQYVRCGWYKKDLFNRTGTEKASLTQYVRWGWCENLFSVKMLGEAGIKNPFNLIGCSTALKCGSFLEKTSKKSTCAVMIRIIITFANQKCD